MASKNFHLYDDIAQNWFPVALSSDIQDLITLMDDKELQLIPSEQGSRGLRYWNGKLEYSNDEGITWTEIQTGGGNSSSEISDVNGLQDVLDSKIDSTDLTPIQEVISDLQDDVLLMVKTVNGINPDVNGNIEIQTVELHHIIDGTDDKAITPKAVKDYINDLESTLTINQFRTSVVYGDSIIPIDNPNYNPQDCALMLFNSSTMSFESDYTIQESSTSTSGYEILLNNPVTNKTGFEFNVILVYGKAVTTINMIDSSKTIVFVIADAVKQGLQKAHVPIPFDCKLESIDVSVMTSGISDLEIQIQKSIDLTTWTDVLDSPVVISSGSNQNLINTFTNPVMLNKGDRLTLNVLTDSKCENLAMNIEISKQ